jgi:DNA helicase-2/ATP-dependent DNA helicase PcrA
MLNYKTNFEKRLKGLNEKQQLAVDSTDGAVLVLAGPGTGKTELLALRCANIINLGLSLPSNILLLTFTESGAANMRERLHSIIGEASYKVAIYTFHSFASQILERYAENFWNGAVFKVATDLERLNLIENILANLPRDYKLSVKNYEKGFVYTSDVIANIAGLKKGNISPLEYKDLIAKTSNEMSKINALAGEIIAESSGSRTWAKINDTYTKLFEMLNGLSANGNDYAKFLLSTLELAYVSANELSDGKILNEWRDEYFTKDDETKLKILKDSSKDKLQKWNELAIVYSKYQEELISSSLYDYEDMLYMVTREIGSNVNLRNELEEKYQYIMVDEFQDTNDAQLDLIFNLTSSPVNEGNPNILVVGDDDQAIYKFQGAELDNITRFTQKYPKATTIVLDSNYRSTQDVLDYARNIILKANDRLETRNKNITKDLKSQNKEMKNSSEGKIVECEFKNEIDEYEFVATKVNELIQNGVEPHHISVISKKHDSLRDLSNIFNIHSIPYSYEKKEHVLDKKPIHE